MKLTKKETEGLNKDKKRLEEELRTAVLENRNENDGQTTMNDLFKCMKELLEKKVKVNYPCEVCDGQFMELQLQEQKKLHSRVKCNKCRFPS